MRDVRAPAQLASEVEAMMRDQFLDGVTRRLEHRYPGAPEIAYEDVVADSVVRLLEAGALRDIENPRGYLTTIATNGMRRTLKRAAREVLADSDSDDDDEVQWFDRDRDPTESPTEEEAVARGVYEYLTGLVERWENQNLRATTMLVIEGAFLDEPLSGVELAERLSDILGRDVLATTARQWRSRGLRRLRDQLADEGYELDG